MLVGAVGIGLKARLKPRELLISHNAKTAKSPRFAKVGYTPGTRRLRNSQAPQANPLNPEAVDWQIPLLKRTGLCFNSRKSY